MKEYRQKLKKRAKKTFKNYIQNTFIKNMLVITSIIIFVTFAVLFVDFRINLIEKNKAKNKELSDKLADEYSFLIKDLDNISTNDNFKSALINKDSYTLNKFLYPFSNGKNKLFSYRFIAFNDDGKILAENNRASGQIVDEEKLFKELQSPSKASNLDKENTLLNKASISHGLNKKDFKLVENYPYYIAKEVAIKDKSKAYIALILDLSENGPRFQGSESDILLVTDSFDNIIYSSKSDMKDTIGKVKYSISEGEVNLDGLPYYASLSSIIDENFQVISLKNISGFYSSLKIAIFSSLLSLLVVLIVASNSSRKVANKSVKVINSLSDGLNQLKVGNLDYTIDEKTFDEFQEAYDEFNTMTRKIKALMKKNEEISELKRLTELKQLESQFNPHFVYNVMEMIRYEIIFEPEIASKLLVKFANLMKYNTNYGNVEVKLETDLTYISDYLAIQKMRFKDRLNYEIRVDQDLLNISIPKLIIQPIVENSIKYGMESTKNLNIEIRGIKKDQTCEIIIKDNGPGMDEATLNEINTLLEKENLNTAHIGLYNTNRILKLNYGPAFGLKINSELGKGTKVRINLPLNGKKDV